MRVVHDSSQEELRVEDLVVLGNHATRDGKNGSEERDVEEDGSVWCNLKVEDQVRVED
jgi:hypothetical protein